MLKMKRIFWVTLSSLGHIHVSFASMSACPSCGRVIKIWHEICHVCIHDEVDVDVLRKSVLVTTRQEHDMQSWRTLLMRAHFFRETCIR